MDDSRFDSLVLPRIRSRISLEPSPPPKHPDMTGCWLWTGCVGRFGMAITVLGSRSDATRRHAYVHRYVYEACGGAIGEHQVVTHLCEVHQCMRPSHMRAVSRSERNAVVGRVEAIARNERYRRYRDRHPDKVRESWRIGREYVRANPEKRAMYRDTATAKRYGLTIAEYRAMRDACGNRCEICGQPSPGNKRLAVDHCRETGDVRGMLCSKHNLALGGFSHDVHLLEAAIKYLTKDRSA